jgi:hypothetical protein
MIIQFFQGIKAVFDSIDEKGYNKAAEKSCDVSIGPSKPTIHITGLVDYFHGFAIPNSYFHLNAIYMMLGNAEFKLGQDVYLETFMSEQQQKDWGLFQGLDFRRGVVKQTGGRDELERIEKEWILLWGLNSTRKTQIQ